MEIVERCKETEDYLTIGGNGKSENDDYYEANTLTQFTLWPHMILLTFFGVKLQITCASHGTAGRIFLWVGLPGAMIKVDVVGLKKEWSIRKKKSPKLCFRFDNTTTSDGLMASDFHFIDGRQISPESFVVAREVIAALDGVERKEERMTIQKQFFDGLDKKEKDDFFAGRTNVRSRFMMTTSLNLDNLFRQADTLVAVIQGTYELPMTTTKKKKKKKKKKIASDSEEGSSDSEEGSSDCEEGSSDSEEGWSDSDESSWGNDEGDENAVDTEPTREQPARMRKMTAKATEAAEMSVFFDDY